MSKLTVGKLRKVLDSNEKEKKAAEFLKKRTKELKNDYENLNNSVVVKNYYIKNSIPIQKIKDKISERQFELQQEYKNFEDDAILIVLQGLLKREN